MSAHNKIKKNIKQNTSDMANGLYNSIKKAVNTLPLGSRLIIAGRILRGRW
jgi:hypothetical protein